MTAVFTVSILEVIRVEVEGKTIKSDIILEQLLIEVISNKFENENCKFPLRVIFCMTELTVSDF